MFRYNLIHLEAFEDYESSGIAIMLTESYQKMISENPGLIHENFGDLYSHTCVENIADIVRDSFNDSCEKHNLFSAIVVDGLELEDCNTQNNYVVKEAYGARVVLAQFFEDENFDNEHSVDGYVIEYLVEALVDDWTKGSIAKFYHDNEENEPPQKNVLAKLTLGESDEFETIN